MDQIRSIAESSVTAIEDSVLRPIRGANTFEDAVERILQAIKLGIVGYGERLPAERALAARLGISRVTLREALRALQESGHVESRRGRSGGTFVTYQPRLRPRADSAVRRLARSMGDTLNDALTFRAAVEPGAAALAAERRLTADQETMLRQQLAAVNTASLADYRQADSRFHLAIAQFAGSPTLTAAVADVRTTINDLLDAIPFLDVNIAHSRDQHEAIVGAILAGDAERARDEMAAHVEGTAALLRGFLS